jgi:hypothetical protein
MPSLLISDAEFRLLPTNVQQILMANFLPEAENAGDPTASDEGEEPPDISPAQAKKIILGCGSKTVDVQSQGSSLHLLKRRLTLNLADSVARGRA